MIEYIRTKSIWISIVFFSFSSQSDDFYESINSSRSFLNVQTPTILERDFFLYFYHFRVSEFKITLK
ncbi:hypothetical protein LEP1GSC062_3753 [Leptospira alexanderi serovar Manhao 3 str. L 60]|uniref:Uncharacterized protein n=1 Tax=Leptospira alexanderi serovar Manhao 3 str. L 60 TaxID=1049759 RepID=V6IF12_9LEPT|nr:hypothetical protein LEP1GSC062_3753 [Leptospira alexanderi serovar Manhao 3 str. L 60]